MSFFILVIAKPSWIPCSKNLSSSLLLSSFLQTSIFKSLLIPLLYPSPQSLVICLPPLSLISACHGPPDNDSFHTLVHYTHGEKGTTHHVYTGYIEN